MPKFKKRPIEDFKFVGGCLKDKKDKRDFRLAGIQEPISLPCEFYLTYDLGVKTQYSRPSCTAQAQSSHKEKQEKIKLSARFIMAKTKELEGNSNWGAYIRNTFKVVHDIGAVDEYLLPEPDASMSWEEYVKVNTNGLSEYAKKHRSGSYWRVEPNVEAIKQAVYQNKQSVVIGIPWFQSYNKTGSDGILPPPDKNASGHAVEVCGFKGNKLWCKNSFGAWWGKKGFFWYEDSPQRKIFDAWISLDLEEEYPVDQRYGQKRTWTSYLREKAVAFNPWLIKKIKRLPNNREINGLAYGFWHAEAVFFGSVGTLWLYKTKPQYLKEIGLI